MYSTKRPFAVVRYHKNYDTTTNGRDGAAPSPFDRPGMKSPALLSIVRVSARLPRTFTLAECADMGLDLLIPFIPDAGQMETYGRALHVAGRLMIYIGGILMLLF